MKALSAIQTALLITAISAVGQGTFQNLDFESAQVIPDPYYGRPDIIVASNALPAWQAFNGTNQLADVFYNSGFYVELVGGTNSMVIDGNFSVALNGGSISQTASVPADAESLLFRALNVKSPFPPGLLYVTLDGQNLAYTAISNGTTSYGLDYTIYAVDISAFAGQVENLTFSGGRILDDIQFSPEFIPEPSPSWLLVLGSGIWIYTRNGGRHSASNCSYR
jgi:hypothetical protein